MFYYFKPKSNFLRIHFIGVRDTIVNILNPDKYCWRPKKNDVLSRFLPHVTEGLSGQCCFSLCNRCYWLDVVIGFLHSVFKLDWPGSSFLTGSGLTQHTLTDRHFVCSWSFRNKHKDIASNKMFALNSLILEVQLINLIKVVLCVLQKVTCR